MFHERARTIVSENNSSDLSFRFSVNPYRGCLHACSYCYARTSHQYWDFGAGTDFETKLVVKTNAVELLRARFMRKSWRGELIVFSGNTDCYQPLEASYRLTRGLLEVCRDFRNPVSIITKGALIRRDIDLLSSLGEVARVHVSVTIPFVDTTMARLVEPGAPSPAARLKAIRALSEAGVSVGVSLAPLIPGLNDDQLVDVLERSAGAGARVAFMGLVRLAGEVRTVFSKRLREAFPDRADKVLNGIREARGGPLYRGGFGTRMRGEGPRWQTTQQLFDVTCRRLGLNAPGAVPAPTRTFKRPSSQYELL